MPNVNYRGNPSQDPDLMTEEELSAAFEAMPLPARQEAMRRALDEEIGPVAVMTPTSGVTSIPLGSPWPPLSREQVVKLHQALVEFTEGLLGVDPEDEGNWDTVRVAGRLEVVLRDLGIGRPAAKMSKRTWAHEEVAKVAEVVQVEPPKRNCWTCDHDKVFGGGTAHICTALPPRRAKGTGDLPTVKAISAWTDSQTLDASLMPPKDSDGCPGWEPKS